MKKAELIFSAILVPLDYLMLVGAALLAYSLRFYANFIPGEYTQIPLTQFMGVLLLTAAVWLVIFAFGGLYSVRGQRRIVEEVRRVFFACSTGLMGIIILFFFNRDLFASRFIILASYIFAVFFVSFARICIVYFERYLFARGVGVHSVVLVGNTHIAQALVEEIETNTGLGLRVLAQYDDFTDTSRAAIFEAHKTGELDEVIQTNPNATREAVESVYEFCSENHIVFKYAAALFDTQTMRNIDVQPVAGIPIVEVKKTRLDGWGRILKRTFDIVGSLVLILLSSPLMLLTAIAIVLDTGRPVLFSRRDNGEPVKRVGQFKQLFDYYKFRSMVQNSDSMRYNQEMSKKDTRKGSPLVKIKDDPRVTRVGRVIRRFSIDELPEFFLVLSGKMSLVGPRPHLPEEVAQYAKHHKQVLNMKPGVTGMAQVSGRSDLDFEDEVRLDVFYMENWSLWLDVVILIKTPIVIFRRRKAL
jgi:exopolysaccharide biosynthesis polyprenyl glycosylphosphotransferase